MLVKLSNSFPTEPLLRQTPGGLGFWKGDEFRVNDPDLRSCDVWVVLDDVTEEEWAEVQSGQAILVTMDPPITKDYRAGFLAQFDLVVSCHRNLRHPNVRNEYQGQPWHIGLHKGPDANSRSAFRGSMGYDELAQLRMPQKTKALSVVCSATDRLPGHRARLAFVEALRARLGDRVDVFGRGVRPVADKFDAIAPYCFHVAMENTALPQYWTEKLADAFLGWAFPLYWGCRNIFEYFPENSLVQIDIERPGEAIDAIESVAFGGLTDEQTKGLAEARGMVLDRYNTFEVVQRLCRSLSPASPRVLVLRPQRDFRPSRARRLLRRAARRLPLGLRER